jgi:hypothetical protein
MGQLCLVEILRFEASAPLAIFTIQTALHASLAS